MSELSRLQRALQEERRRRQQACSAAKDQVSITDRKCSEALPPKTLIWSRVPLTWPLVLQEAWSRQQQLRERELRKLSERVQKLREERERLSEEVKQLRDHNYSLMSDVTSLGQEKSAALLANRDLQIEVS